MDTQSTNDLHGLPPAAWYEPTIVMAELAPDADGYYHYAPPPPPRPRLTLRVVLLFFATCLTTLMVRGEPALLFALRHHFPLWEALRFAGWEGLMYAAPVMTILLCHEMGHYVQMLRYGVFAELPLFLPMPLGPIGTFGAVIVMEPHRGDRKSLFDIGISGPLAGLVPTILFLWLGLHWSHLGPVPAEPLDRFGTPLLLKLLEAHFFPVVPHGMQVDWHPVAFAGWVGLLITSLNLFPVGQLDGGHILYGMIRGHARWVARLVLLAAIAVVILNHWYQWWLMLFLLMVMGTRHPPTANDDVPLGVGRYILGTLTLAFIILGFTPTPFGAP